MATLPNSPPGADQRASGRVTTAPVVLHESVAKVRVTSAGPVEDYQFAGKSFGREGEIVSASSLGWDNDDAARAAADPNLVIEYFDKDGRLVKKNGKLYPTVGELNPPPKPKKED